jgi:hypothetical protein
VFYLRRFVLLAVVLSLAGPALAEDETLFPEVVESGYFGGSVGKITWVNHESAILVGVRGGWIVNHQFVVGGGAYYLIDDVLVEDTGIVPAPELLLAYGGPELEYIGRPAELVHYTLCALIGAGMVDYLDSEGGQVDEVKEDFFFVFEPAVNLMLNFTELFRIGAGVSYRYVYGVNLEGLENRDLRGPCASLTLKFGKL